MDFLSHLPDELQLKLNELKKLLSPHTSRAYIVGGGVRDVLLGKIPHDLDIELYDISPEKFDSLAQNWGAVGVGKSFFVYKWKDVDLSLPRIESKVAKSHQGFEVEYCNDEKEASSRRDFTMNALMVNIFTGELKDYWDGARDIKQKTIRYIRKKSFCEDSLRVLRGIRFASSFGFAIERETMEVMKQMNLDELSKNRIFWELEKIFVSNYPTIGLLYLHEIGILRKLLGVDTEFLHIFNIAKKMQEFYKHKTEFLHKYIFLYILLNELNMDIKKSLEILEAPKNYYKILLNSPYKLLEISDRELLQISLDIPLSQWVGICQKGLVKRAQNLGIFDEIFIGHVNAQDVISDGFSGKGIADELRKRRLQKIEQICEKSDG